MAHCVKCGHKIKCKKVGCRRCGKRISVNCEEIKQPFVPVRTDAEITQFINAMATDLQERLKISAMPSSRNQEKQI